MKENGIKMALVLGTGMLLILYLLLRRPDYLASSSSLALFIGAEVLLGAVAKYRKVFFPILMLAFLVAGSGVPGHFAFQQGRWVVLGVGAVVGLAIYMKSPDHHFGPIHLVALFCILSALVSASVSAYPLEARLKAVSLGLLLVYACAGARLAVSRVSPEQFSRGLLAFCELLTWFCGVSYLVLSWQVFGNPNSLGAITGVVLVPVLLWGMLTCESSGRRIRLTVALGLGGLLLMSSFSRAGISSALFVFFLTCLALRRYRLMIKGTAAVFVFALCAVVFIPHSTYMPDVTSSQSLQDAYLYKGKQEAGVLGSRRSVWQETWSSIQESPWFGTGFGTSKVSGDLTAAQYAVHHVDSWVIREHGNSYLAITEWTGLLGVVPFYTLIGFTAMYACKVFAWLRRSGNVFSPAVPVAAFVLAGLFHATFEDWMFAVGYYLCVFFWATSFILVDVLPWRAVVIEPTNVTPLARCDYLPIASGQ